MTQDRNKSEIAAAYNEWAETYDTDHNRTRDLAAQVLRQVDLNFADRRIIEVGCGTGRNTEWLSQLAAGPREIAALDFSAEMLERARERVRDPRVRLIQHDARTAWPLVDASADIVIAMLVLEHVEHLEPVFAEAFRTLNAGGEFFICELHPMRQLLGGQAQFTSCRGQRQLVPAFLHNTSEYVQAGLSCGFELLHLDEWRDADAQTNDFPRLLSLHFRRQTLAPAALI
jgi:ubiquinone/menaquinone biosynthesis C-methylase UbiE